MKIILSRKGFDSTSGECPSPIMPDGTLLSLPIPDDTPSDFSVSDKSITFSDLHHNGFTYAQILKGLRPNKSFTYCHLDPDIRNGTHIKPFSDWKPAFGQTSTALSILRNTGVEVGDIFLFFGLFQNTEYDNDSIRFVKGSKPIQVIYGYLQIGRILSTQEEIAEYHWHPHAYNKHYEKDRNALFIPSDTLSFDSSLSGYGVLNYHKDRVLTMQGENTATWSPHSFLMPDNIYDARKNSAKSEGVYYAGRWQELVLKQNKDAEIWAKSIITLNNSTQNIQVNKKVSSWHIGIAAEAFAAGIFARFGFNVSVQYGANQPEYDLLVEKNKEVMMVSVKGSQTGSWGLIQAYKKKDNTYHEAADDWSANQSDRVIFCLVQFHGKDEMTMPTVYLARHNDIAERLKASRNGNGETILHENHTWKSGLGYGTTERLPEHWKFSAERIDKLIR